ncbi:MAG: fimbrillin family protein, partial [Tidjanibacter sp.]|nr:fimbrillin family protein [Tidjanibacter sp.]
MKKVLAFAAVVAMVLTGCVKNEVIEPEREIDFNAVNYKAQTGRAEVYGPLAGTTYDTKEHFGAFAFHDTDAW